MPLGDALGDPDDVPALLLLQLDVGVENTEVKLIEEGQLVQLHLQGKGGEREQEEKDQSLYKQHKAYNNKETPH